MSVKLFNSTAVRPDDAPLVPGVPQSRPGTFFMLVDDMLDEASPPWELDPPPGLDPAWLMADVELAAECPCQHCHWGAGLAYVAFHRAPGEYLAWGVCPNCTKCTEL